MVDWQKVAYSLSNGAVFNDFECLVPLQKGDIEAIEKIQKRATKLVISLRKLPYKERLQHLNLYAVKYRRLRGDMIEVFKILKQCFTRINTWYICY